jgi:molybdopterin synthase catalytic subunit
MNLNKLIDKIKNHQDYKKAGMILCHIGVVRETSGNGKKVSGLKVHVDHEKLRNVTDLYKKRPGIIEILIEIAENKKLSVGDHVMHLVVAGDIRENVISTLTDTLNAVKQKVTQKTEFFV